MKLDGDIKIKIDYQKFNDDKKWDGLKGYLTNTDLNKEEVIKQYKQLWFVEKHSVFQNPTCAYALFFITKREELNRISVLPLQHVKCIKN